MHFQASAVCPLVGRVFWRMRRWRVVFERGTEPEYYAADEVDEVVITRRMVEKLGSIEAILAYFDAADITIPPLVVDGDDTGVSGADQS